MGNSDQAYREVPRGRRLSAAARTSAARLADAAPLFAALGDGTRLKLVTRLCGEGPLSITRLTAGERVTRQAVSKHLRALEKAGLARSSRRDANACGLSKPIGSPTSANISTRSRANGRRRSDAFAPSWRPATASPREGRPRSVG